MGWVVFGIVAGVALFDVLLRALVVKLALPLFERRFPFAVEPTPPDPTAEEIEFPTSHGLLLRGSLHRHQDRAPRGLVIFCPEMSGDHWSAAAYCTGLWQAGFDVLSFDFRSQGESERMPGYEPLHWITEYEVHDVLAAVTYARGRDDLRGLPIGLFGISRGGSAALAAAARCRDVACVACEGAFTTDSLLVYYALHWAELYVPRWVAGLIPLWHLRGTMNLVRLTSQVRRGCRYTVLEQSFAQLRHRPVLIIADGDDAYVHPTVPEQMSRGIGPGCRFWLVPGARHNGGRLADREGYDRRLLEFFSQAAEVPAVSRPKTPPQKVQ